MKKKELTFKDLMALGVGGIIGSGIFAMVGIGIAYTGKSVSLALAVGALVNLIMNGPYLFTAGAVSFTGGVYGMSRILLGDKWGALMGILRVMVTLMIAIYCIALIEYAAELVPFFGEYPKLFASLVLILFFLVTLTGTKGMAKFQGVIVVIMLVTLLMFIIYGVREVQPSYFTEGYFANGPFNFILAIALLSFASTGASELVNYYEVTRNPRRNIPLALISASLLVGVIYFLVGVVASGVLPVEQVADETLGMVANAILPPALYVTFIIGGAMLALASTLINGLAYMRFPIMALAKDGYLPRAFLKTTKKDYPYVLMGFLFLAGLLPIITGLKIDEIVSVVLGPVYILATIMSIRVMKLPAINPEGWLASPFRVPKPILIILSILAAVAHVVMGVLLITNLSPVLMIASLIFGITAIIYVIVIDNKIKKNKAGTL